MYNFTTYELSTIEKGWKYYHKNDKTKDSIKSIRICAYLRKSTEDIKDNSLKLQLAEINNFVKNINEYYKEDFMFYLEEEDIFSEDNVSGMQGRKRPQFDRMLSFIETNPGYYGVCVVYKMDRFSRKLEDTLKYISLLKTFKCVLKALDFDDNGDPTSDLLKNILGVVAQYHAQNSALTSIKGTIKKVEENKAVGLLPFGLISEKNKNGIFNQKGASNIVIDESKATIVRDIFTKYASGMSIKDIEIYLTKKGYKKEDGSRISYQQIKYMLRNKRYNGTYVYADPNNKHYYKYDNGVKKPDYYIKENAFPKIIDDNLFERVQVLLNNKNNSHQMHSDKTKYLLSGLIVCGDCNKMLHGWSRPKYKGKIYADYVCSTHKVNKTLCSTKRVNKEYIEKVIISILENISNKIISKAKDKIDIIINKILCDKELAIKELIKQIKIKENKLNYLIDHLLLNNKHKSIYESKIKVLENELEELYKNKTEHELIYTKTKKVFKKMLKQIMINDKLLLANFNLTKILINLLFEKIYLSNEKLEIVFFDKKTAL